MSDIRYPTSEEVKVKIDEETKLVSMIAARLMIDDVENFIDSAFKLVDGVIKVQEARLDLRQKEEFKRRRGY